MSADEIAEVRVPNWGMSAGEAAVNVWLKSVGERVVEGEPVVELEAEKTTIQVESPASGVVSGILAEVGDEVKPGQVIARIIVGIRNSGAE
jgi:pyruvate/2-oxoglutarate dehydrogenase complex dihydrolipoamide acyltransferase (E2) component